VATRKTFITTTTRTTTVKLYHRSASCPLTHLYSTYRTNAFIVCLCIIVYVYFPEGYESGGEPCYVNTIHV